MEKVLMSPKSLSELGLKPSEATLSRVIKLFKTPSHQRTSKSIWLLQALTRKIKFFIQKIEELGEDVHIECCRSMTYEFFPSGEVTSR